MKCKTIFMKARTNISEDGILMAALSEEDLERVSGLVTDLQIVRFHCGHGIHFEKSREFVKCLEKLA